MHPEEGHSGLKPESQTTGSWREICLLLVAAASLLAPAPAFGQDGSAAWRTLTPPAAAGPTTVFIDLYDVEVFGIDEVEETFEVEADLAASWLDERLAFDPAAAGTEALRFQGAAAEEALKSQVWWPDFEIPDGRGSRDRIHLELSIDSDGWVRYHERFTAVIKQNLDLGSFPFDVSDISLTVTPYSYNAAAVTFSLAEDAGQTLGWEPSEWIVSDPTLAVSSGFYCAVSGGACAASADCPAGEECTAGFATATVEMTISRVPDHYLWKIILPLALIVLASTAVFWLDFESFGGDRLAVSFTGVLTVVAFDFVIAGSLPKLWYTTTLDRILIAAYIFLAACCAENGLAALLSRRSPQAARRLDWLSRFLFPLAFLVVLVALLVSG